MVGLSVDVGIMYIVKTKLSAATDAAAIAGARSLNRGVDFNAQKDSAVATAVNYFRANFADGYLLTANSSITTTVTASGLNTRIVASTATATVPVFFLRFLKSGPPSVTVNVAATATRRDSNVMLVMDRSGSLASASPDACGPMKAAATGFVDKFAEQTDYVGLVTFASSSYYMDFPIATTFKTSSPSLPSIISNIICTGGTSSALGLWNGYTALANLAQPGALNVIVYFTDGNPTAFVGQFPILATSGCSNILKAQIPGIFGTMTENGNSYGLLRPWVHAVPITSAEEITPESTDPLTSADTSLCSFKKNGVAQVKNDITALPTSGKDYFENLLTGDEAPVNLTSGDGIDNASRNAAIDAANRIRNGSVINKISAGAPAPAIGKSLANVVIFGIGIGSVDPVFMKRVANVANVATDPNPSFNPAQQTGFYKYCLTVDDLQDAFDQVASEVLRLSK